MKYLDYKLYIGKNSEKICPNQADNIDKGIINIDVEELYILSNTNHKEKVENVAKALEIPYNLFLLYALYFPFAEWGKVVNRTNKSYYSLDSN